MARLMTEWPSRRPDTRPVASKYMPFLDGQVWELEQGKDFDGEPMNFANVLRQLAYRHGIKARVSFSQFDSRIYVQATQYRSARLRAQIDAESRKNG